MIIALSIVIAVLCFLLLVTIYRFADHAAAIRNYQIEVVRVVEENRCKLAGLTHVLFTRGAITSEAVQVIGGIRDDKALISLIQSETSRRVAETQAETNENLNAAEYEDQLQRDRMVRR